MASFYSNTGKAQFRVLEHVEHLKALERSVRRDVNSFEHLIDQPLAERVVAAGVVSGNVLLGGDELFCMAQLAVGLRSVRGSQRARGPRRVRGTCCPALVAEKNVSHKAPSPSVFVWLDTSRLLEAARWRS